MFVYPYKKGSKSAKALGKALGIKVLTRPKQSKYKKGLVISWGSTPNHLVNNAAFKGLNAPIAVLKACNKLTSFQLLKESMVSVPCFTTDIEVAKGWIADEEVVVCRKLLRSHSGKGIVIASKVEELVVAPLYVKYFKKSHEYRWHVFNGKVIDAVKKRKKNDAANYNKYIRVHGNGWVFCRNDIVLSEGLKSLAINAVKALGLDFGAVDIVSKSDGEAKVLEVNTAPSLSGPTTLKSYTDAVKEYVNGL